MKQYQPRFLRCCDCGEEFTFTVDAQQYWELKGYLDDPRRCKECFRLHKAQLRYLHSSPQDDVHSPA
jgi:hypothetical protein